VPVAVKTSGLLERSERRDLSVTEKEPQKRTCDRNVGG
jgi:hypothetical protein